MLSFPNAKINLGLNVTEKRPDGYHNIETIFYPIPLEDAIEVAPSEKHTLLHVSYESYKSYKLHKSQETDLDGDPEQNLVMKAYRLLEAEFGLPPVEIYLVKHIPTGAGLGGGSADAAFMLKLLNEEFNLRLTDEQLEERAARLGADCAFFVKNRPTFAEGIGNVFSPLPSLTLKGYRLWLVKPDIHVSTREAYARVTPRKPRVSLREIAGRPVEEWRGAMVNDFEESVFPQFPAIGEMKEEMYRRGAVYASMSGSGSSVYGIFRADVALPEDRGYVLQL